jgi:hypothetical protein
VRIRLHRARLSVRKEMSQLLGAVPEDRKCQTLREEAQSAKAKKRQRPAECRDLFANLSEYLDGRVEPLTCEQMRGHIEACPSCVAFLRDLRAAIDRCRSLEIPCDSGRRTSIARHPYTGIPAHAGDAGSKINIRDSVTNRSCRVFLLMKRRNHDGSKDYASRQG